MVGGVENRFGTRKICPNERATSDNDERGQTRSVLTSDGRRHAKDNKL